jgi:hypothetical protein
LRSAIRWDKSEDLGDYKILQFYGPTFFECLQNNYTTKCNFPYLDFSSVGGQYTEKPVFQFHPYPSWYVDSATNKTSTFRPMFNMNI